MKTPVAVLASGGGTNLQALIDACERPDFPARIALVLSNVAGAGALERAKKAGLPRELLEHRSYSSREAYDRALIERLRAHGAEWICLAGFMRIITTELLSAFPGRILNIHPALLPAFPGMHGPRQALAYGVKVAGCTVHFVDEGTDTGPIIAQAAVEVRDEDTEATLAARILEQEHRLYPQALALAVSGQLRIEGRLVRRAAR